MGFRGFKSSDAWDSVYNRLSKRLREEVDFRYEVRLDSIAEDDSLLEDDPNYGLQNIANLFSIFEDISDRAADIKNDEYAPASDKALARKTISEIMRFQIEDGQYRPISEAAVRAQVRTGLNIKMRDFPLIDGQYYEFVRHHGK